jgi:hypothetical protein
MQDWPEDWRAADQFSVVRVSRLPYAHNPFKCTHAPQTVDVDFDGRRFFESLTREQFGSCRYHRVVDWKLVAKMGVQLFWRHRQERKSTLNRAILAVELDEPNKRALLSLFSDPIVWERTGPAVVDGQHRLCAIRAAGARLCLIDHNRLDLDAVR